MIFFNFSINIEYSLLVVSIRQKKCIMLTKIMCPEFKQEKNLEEIFSGLKHNNYLEI